MIHCTKKRLKFKIIKLLEYQVIETYYEGLNKSGEIKVGGV